jgi:NADH-quinone oxidoreductase subunit N
MLIGLAVPGAGQSSGGGQAVLFYLLVYSLMTLGVFGILTMLWKQDRPVETIDELKGLGTSHPLAALLLAVFLFGLTGLPPTVGFWGKFNLFWVAWASGTLGMRTLAIGLALNAAIAAWYYLRLVKSAYLDSQTDPTSIAASRGIALYGATALCAVGAIGFFFFPGMLWELIVP